MTQALTHLPLPVGRPRGDVDLEAAQNAARDLLEALGVTQIPFHSLCEHHLLPFVVVAHVGTTTRARSSCH